MHEASFYTGISETKVKCILCPHECVIRNGASGICKVRSCKNGKLISDTYGRLSAVAVDPIEKKPLYHFHPGGQILSLGSIGCNMHCDHCQNEQISQCIGISPNSLRKYTIDEICRRASATGTQMVAFTYNEPAVNYEFMLDTARIMTDAGKSCVMVSNGYIMPDPLEELLPHMEAFNIDLKAFDDGFYRKVTGARLDPVLRTMERISEAGKHLEVTYLVIPGMNDDQALFSEMTRYLSSRLGRQLVLHLSRYFPRYKMKLAPTPVETLAELTEIARQDLDYVYPGNTGPVLDANTYCPSCGHLLIERTQYQVHTTGIDKGRCAQCEQVIPGKFSTL